MSEKADYVAGLEKFVYINTPDEIYREVGRAIVNLSNSELLLGAIFSLLCEPIHGKIVVTAFDAMGNFERRVVLVDLMVRRTQPGLVLQWEKIYNKLRTHKGVRNIIAHHSMVSEQADTSGNIELVLQKSVFKLGKAKSLKFKDIASTADALDDVKRDLVKLLNGLAGIN